VLAKPAEQTPLIATEVVRILFEAGVPRKALQLLPGAGESIGSLLVKDPRVAGVMFTGSTSVARLIQNHLSERLNKKNQPIPFIAETGGLNAMIVDSSALTEQVVTDVMKSRGGLIVPVNVVPPCVFFAFKRTLLIKRYICCGERWPRIVWEALSIFPPI